MRAALFLALAGLLCSGCAHQHADVVHMQITSQPAGAAATFRVVSQDDPSRGVSGWLSLGNTPVGGTFSMPAGWSAPTNLVEVRVAKDGLPPYSRTYSPAAILSDGRYLRDHLMIPSGPLPAR